MKKLHLFLLMSIEAVAVFAQPGTTGGRHSLQIEADVQAAPAQIELIWPLDNNASGYEVFRKNKDALNFSSSLASLPGSATGYVDATAEVNKLYDYKVIGYTSGLTRIGSISSGIEVKLVSNRGIALVVLDTSHLLNGAFSTAFNTYMEDLEVDGWYPKLIKVGRDSSETVASVKTKIMNAYNENTAKTKMVVLVGNVPVPYSGEMNPDAHGNHIGAWPTDTYYGDVDGNWTDNTVNNTSSANYRNRNVPGDGKFDQSWIPSNIDLQVGRIDLAHLTAFAQSETQLLTKYLNKAHEYKTAGFTVEERALVDDNFGGLPFSMSGYNNFAAMFGSDDVYNNSQDGVDYFTDLSYNTSSSGTYLWSYGCGGGNYTGAGGIGNTNNFAADSLSSVFTMLFGSYFGDWNYPNAFLRAPLAQGNTLTNSWSGRPNHHYFHMAMGENIGYCIKLSQNNQDGQFKASFETPLYARFNHNSLMGDPSLRLTYIEGPTNLNISEQSPTSNQLTWTASAAGSVIGYNIYRRYSFSPEFVKLNTDLVTGTTFTDDQIGIAGTIYYYVKAVEMKTTASGTYHNESLGLKGETISVVGLLTHDEEGFSVYPNPAGDMIHLEVTNHLLGKEYLILDLSGKVAAQGAIQGKKQAIDISGLSQGVYQIIVPGTTSSEKIMKM